MSQEHSYMSLAQLLFSYKGRINRVTYGLYWFIYIAIVFVTIAVENVAGQNIAILLHTLFIYTAIPATVKRLHDTNKSGREMFWLIVPLAGIIYIFFLSWVPGTSGPNAYGESTSEVILKK